MAHFESVANAGEAGRPSALKYRLALDLGSTSLGWAMIRLDHDLAPCAVIRAGVRIFSSGRDPQSGASLAVSRREARAARRRRDRLLRRKARMMQLLIRLGFFPADEPSRKALERLNPYLLRAKGLDEPLSGPEFARALFHINQRRGFKSNRRTDTSDATRGPLKAAISELALALDPTGRDGKARSVGELLHRRQLNRQTVRARYRETRTTRQDGRPRIEKSYDLYIDRSMIAAEFDALWAVQSAHNPSLYTEDARTQLRDCLLYQRHLKPVTPGRCTLLPTEERAPFALPDTQRFRIYQEVNNLRVLHDDLRDAPLSIEARDTVVALLERHGKRTFDQLRTALALPGSARFNLEDAKRKALKGNATSAALSKPSAFGARWYAFDGPHQAAIVEQLLTEENESVLVAWLQTHTGIDEATATTIAGLTLPDGYGSLSRVALSRILPELQADVVSFATAASRAGFHHSQLSTNEAIPGRTFPVESVNTTTGEVRTWHVFKELPYYGEVLQRYVAFGSGDDRDPPERRFGRIANPTVHIGLNQVRTVVNALIKRYGHPTEVILELARDLKQSRDERRAEQERQADGQRRNERLRNEAAAILGAPGLVKAADLHRLLLWEELSRDPLERRCPYSGRHISLQMALSDEVEVDHILPFSRTLDDGLSNKTLALRAANRIKGNRTPSEARADFEAQGWAYDEILARAAGLPRNKRYRFGEDGYVRWLRDEKDFLARALNDTRYLSRVAREYVRLICPQDTRAIPGQLTALLRRKFGLNDVLGVSGEKNRNDHRHHAVDACVIGVTDQRMLQRFAQASASASGRHVGRLVETMPFPWPTYRDHVSRAVAHIWVSHRPDHSHEGAMHNATAYGLRGEGRVVSHKTTDGVRERVEERLAVIPITEPNQARRHGVLADGSPRPYKGYKGDSNYCMEVVRDEKGSWMSEVVSTFEAYQLVRKSGTPEILRRRDIAASGRTLAMRLMINDVVRLELDEKIQTMRVATIKSSGVILLAPVHEANVDARARSRDDAFRYTSKSAGSLRAARGRRVTVSPIGDLSDPGFRG